MHVDTFLRLYKMIMHDVLKLGKILAVVKFLDSVLASIYQKARQNDAKVGA